MNILREVMACANCNIAKFLISESLFVRLISSVLYILMSRLAVLIVVGQCVYLELLPTTCAEVAKAW